MPLVVLVLVAATVVAVRLPGWFTTTATVDATSAGGASPSGATSSGARSSAVTPSATSGDPSGDPSGAVARQRSQALLASPGTAYHVVGLGDSVPAGNACSCTTYVTLAGQAIAGRFGRTARIDNLAGGGQTTAGVLDQLTDATVAAKVAAADLIIITVGANDFDSTVISDDDCAAPEISCYQSALRAERRQLDAVLSRIEKLQADGASATVMLTGYWNVFLDGAVGRSHGSTYVSVSDALTRAENQVVSDVAAAHTDTYVDIYSPFKGDAGTRDDTALLAADGDHPSATGHTLIAQAVEAAFG